MSLRNEQLSPSQMVVDRKRFAELQSMEYRHLGYVRAAEYMGLLQQRHAKWMRECDGKAYHQGYLDAIKTMSEVQLRMVAQVIDAHPGHDREPGPFRKGQLCMMNKQGCYCLVVARDSEGA